MKPMCIQGPRPGELRAVVACAYAYPASSAAWKNSIEVVHTCGEPPKAGRTIRPTIGSKRNRSAAAKKEVRTKRVAMGG